MLLTCSMSQALQRNSCW